MMLLEKSSYWWWFDSHISPRRSPWLQSTLSELEEKTKAMLRLIEEDADSFAQRAEMYYKKRPKVVNMVEDFYRGHRSLAEKYDQLKSEAGTRVVLTQLGSPLSKENSAKHLKRSSDKYPVASSDSFDSEDSDVDDPDQEETQMDLNIGERVSNTERVEGLIGNVGSQYCFPVVKDQLSNMREEIEKLKEENTTQKAEIMQRNQEQAMRQKSTKEALKAREGELLKLKEEIKKLKEQNRMQNAELSERNEEKKEVIRQLSFAINILKEENSSLRKCIKETKKKSSSRLQQMDGNLFWEVV